METQNSKYSRDDYLELISTLHEKIVDGNLPQFTDSLYRSFAKRLRENYSNHLLNQAPINDFLIENVKNKLKSNDNC